MRAAMTSPPPRVATGASASPRAAAPRASAASTTRGGVRAASGSDDASDDPASRVLGWLARATDDASLEGKVALRDLGDGRGRGLVALRNLAPDEVVFSLPWDLVFAEEEEEDPEDPEDPARRATRVVDPDDPSAEHEDSAPMPWSARMAMRLLEERARGDDSPLAPWIAALPSRVSTPPLEYDAEDVAEAEDAAIDAEVAAVAFAHADACLELEDRLRAIGCDADVLRWATGVLHSRCFTYGARGRHLLAPGVDMCNHDAEAKNAVARVVHSPETCQGAVATSEIAPTTEENTLINRTPAGASESFFQLRAGEDGVEEGAEVLISYGDWPNDPFFLYFGFVPAGNRHDAVVLFDTVDALASCAVRLGLIEPGEASATGIRKASEAVAIGKSGDASSAAKTGSDRGLVLTREGVDGGVIAACDVLGVESWVDLVEGRCLELLRAYRTTLKEDRALLDAATAEGRLDAATAIAYRASKKEVLLGPVAAGRARRAAEEAARQTA